jgi:hypothetical protein
MLRIPLTDLVVRKVFGSILTQRSDPGPAKWDTLGPGSVVPFCEDGVRG